LVGLEPHARLDLGIYISAHMRGSCLNTERGVMHLNFGVYILNPNLVSMVHIQFGEIRP
jgi:hypothetical protein